MPDFPQLILEFPKMEFYDAEEDFFACSEAI